MNKNKKLKKTLKSGDITTLNELENDGYDFSKIDIFYLIDENYSVDVLQFCINNGTKIEPSEILSSLQLAIIDEKNIEVIQCLLKNRADMDPENNMDVPLVLAVNKGKIDLIKLLIESGANINTVDEIGFTPLIYALLCENKHIPEILIQSGADVNANDKKLSPLNAAVESGDIDMVKLLIKSGADVNAKMNNGTTLLRIACKMGYGDIVKYLLKKGADINSKDKKGSNVLNATAITGNVELVDFLVQNGADATNINNAGNSVILDVLSFSFMANKDLLEKLGINKSLSSYKKDILKIIKLLLHVGTDINIENQNGKTAFVTAVMSRDVKMVKLFIKYGADVNYKDTQGNSVMDLLLMPPNMMRYMMHQSNYVENMKDELDNKMNYLGVELELLFDKMFQKKNSLKITKLLIKHGAVLEKFNTWIIGVVSQDLELVKFVIDNSDMDDYVGYMHFLIVASSPNLKDILFKSIKDVASKEIYGQIFKELSPEIHSKIFELLIDVGVDLNAKNTYGHTALMSTIIYNNITMVKTLLDKKLDLGIQSKTGLRAIDYTLNNKEIRTILLKKGAKFNKEKIDKKSFKEIQKEIKKTIQKEMDIGDLDLTEDEKNIFSEGTSLSYAFKSKKIKDLRIAVLKGADLNVLDVVYLVIKGYSTKFIDLALKNGISKNKQDKEGKTALMHACHLGKTKIVETLIKNGADIDMVDNVDNDVWYYASLSGKEEITELLKKHDELSAPNHAPRDLINILSNFTIDKPIKYTTHTWDFGGLQKEYSDFNGFIKKVKNQWETFEEELEELSPSIHRKIYNFLLNKDPKSQGWLAKDNISIGWSSLDGLEKWCNDGNNPFDFKLSTSFIVNKREIARFGDVINLFKQEIEIRKEYHMLQNFFMDIQENMSDFYSIETAKLNNKNFYADVESFRIALHKIFSEIQKREFAEIKVEAVDTTGEYIDIKIIQVGSFSLNSEAEMLKEVEDGDFADIKKLLTNLCDWSIESSFQNKSYRINYLKSDKKTPEVELLDYQPKGFTHRLRFYKK